jgi:hypothetical protein
VDALPVGRRHGLERPSAPSSRTSASWRELRQRFPPLGGSRRRRHERGRYGHRLALTTVHDFPSTAASVARGPTRSRGCHPSRRRARCPVLEVAGHSCLAPNAHQAPNSTA